MPESKDCSKCIKKRIEDNLLICFWHEPEAIISQEAYGIAEQCEGFEPIKANISEKESS